MAQAHRSWGFDIRDLDRSVRPQDDFFEYASGSWMQKHPIPKSESRWGSFTMLRRATDQQLRTLVQSLLKRRTVRPGSPEQLIRDLYRSGIDVSTRKQLGLAPLQKYIARIDAIVRPEDMLPALAFLEKEGLGGIWHSFVDQDSKRSERYLLHLHQGGLGMPDRDYYLKDDAESKRVRAAYRRYLETLAAHSGFQNEASRAADTVLAIEKRLAALSMKKEDLRDVDKVYHKFSVSKLRSLTPRLEWGRYFHDIGAPVREVIVMQPLFFSGIEKLIFSIPVTDWKTYLQIHAMGSMASFLTPDLEKESFAFYGTALAGTKEMKPLWRRVLSVVNGSLGEPLGKLYVAEYFGSHAKRQVTRIVNDLFRAYEARIKNLDWMSSGTKTKAIRKLHQMNRKLGYPDKWRSYAGLVIRADEYAGNALRIAAFEHRRALSRLPKPVDRKEWFMSPQTVNAYCSFNLNDVVFPAAILQHPFFHVTADDAINYGAIGSVIGHEITHGFDDQGSKFDGKGNRKTWWTQADRSRFEVKAARLVKEFDGYEVESGLRVNGTLTLGENIADLGGLSIAFDAYQLRLAETGRNDIAGFTPEQRFFLGYAATEREQERPEFRKMQVLTNPHAPSKFRVNGPLSNLPEFYAAFNVTTGDKLYREPKDRAKIW